MCCLFYVHEGREVVSVGAGSSRKRKRTDKIKYFSAPFQSHKYRSHHEGQHAASWEEYQKLSKEDKAKYFDGKKKLTETLHAFIDLSEDSVTYTINASIVEVIIGELFFHKGDNVDSDNDDEEEDMDEQAIAKNATLLAKQKQHAMKLFVKSDGVDIYTVEIKGLMRFDLTLDHISIGLSFYQAALAIQHAKDRTKTAKLGGVNDLMVAQWVRVLVAVSLQQIVFIFGHESVWAFSFARDGSTNRGHSFFDTHLCVCYNGVLVNLHFVVLPMFVRHTAFNIFELAVKAFDALFPNWRSKLLSISSDGKNTMTRRHMGFVTRMANEAAVGAVANGTWIEVVYLYSIFLRQPQNLITKMNAKCPKKTNRWTHLGRVLKFYKVHCRRLIEYTTEKNTTKLPGDDWWVLTFALAPVVDAINTTLVLLQSRSIVISQQAEFINNLIASFTDLFNDLLADEAHADNSISLESL